MDKFLLCDEVCDIISPMPQQHRNNCVSQDSNKRLEDTVDGFLLCDEVWDVSPVSNPRNELVHVHRQKHPTPIVSSFHPITKEDFEHSFATCVRKELKFMPVTGYVDLLESNHFIDSCRIKAIQWLIHSQRRFNFSTGIAFNAANYVDRFIYMNRCHGWSYWMMELLFVASLSIALKFGETDTPSLHEIQEGLEHSFEAKLIQKMELKMLKALGWELNCTTPHSYVDLMTWKLNSFIEPFLLDELTSRLNDILLATSFDNKLLAYRPCVIAMCGLRCVLEDSELLPSTCQNCLSHITDIIPSDQTENLQKCYKMMQEILVRFHKTEANVNPSSPDTVLTKEQVAICEGQVDISFIDGPVVKSNLKLSRKRKRGEEVGRVIKHKKCVEK